MMLHVDGVVVSLRKTAGDGLGDAKEPIEDPRAEKRVMNEVVTDAVDVGIHHQRVNETKNQHYPERRVRVQKEEPEKISEMEEPGQSGHGVPAGVREQPRLGCGSFSANCVSVHGGGYHSRKSSFLASCSLPMFTSRA